MNINYENNRFLNCYHKLFAFGIAQITNISVIVEKCKVYVMREYLLFHNAYIFVGNQSKLFNPAKTADAFHTSQKWCRKVCFFCNNQYSYLTR